jgi:hypothetical protein
MQRRSSGKERGCTWSLLGYWAFGSTSHGIRTEAATTHELENTICRQISFMLGNRKIIATLAGETLEGSAARGCPHRGILSPLLWSLVVDKFIRGLNENGYYTVGYADDVAILVSIKFPYTVSELLQDTLRMVQQWCERTQLSINPQKMVTVPFTRKMDSRGLQEPTLSRHKPQLATQVKYSTSDSVWTRY